MSLDPSSPFFQLPKKKTAANPWASGGSAGVSMTPQTLNTPLPSGNQFVIQEAYTPDYGSMISNLTKGAEADANLTVKEAVALRKQLLQTLVIRHGGLAPGYKDKYGDIDKNTLDLAGKNEFSDVKRIGKGYDDSVFAFKRQLAARGGLSSGDLGYGLDRASQSRASSEYDAGNAFADASIGAVSQYAAQERAAKQAIAQAKMQAALAIMGNPAFAPRQAIYGWDPGQQQSQQSNPFLPQPVYAGGGTASTPAATQQLYDWRTQNKVWQGF